ncbi:MAG: hypothetical protein KDB88_11940 [Flavobacteriales bacterium]|nr:hypothetical protein [Flavobacteriales bacterium]
MSLLRILLDNHLSSALLLASIAYALFQWSRTGAPRRPLFRLLGVLLALVLGVELAGAWTSRTGVNNSLMYNAFLPIEYAILLAMVAMVRPRWRGAVITAAIAGVAVFGWSVFTVDMGRFLMIEALLFLALILTLFAMAVLFHLAQTCTEPLPQVPEFWFFLGLLAYFGSILPIVGIARYLYAQDPGLTYGLWTLVPIMSSLRYLLAAEACRRERAWHPEGREQQ